ncbi:putative adipose-regulatory protein-domain-containing protein [Sporodiniella umbellata]|nr:putative adipose-regulatory protein-domain-containing protein [Sporodiniella umbellata]
MSESQKIFTDSESEHETEGQSSDFQVVPSEEEAVIETKVHPVLAMIGQVLQRIFSPILKVFFGPQAQKTFIKSFVLVVLISWVLLTSFTAYLTFYQRYIPKNAHTEPVFFRYDAVPPQANVLLGPQTVLRNEQAYDVSLLLHVPTSDINFELGNFMIQVDLKTHNGTILSQSHRPGILRYQSYSHRMLHVLAKALPLLMGWTEESQKIQIRLMEGFIEKKSQPVRQAQVTLSTPQLQVYDAQLTIVADFRGLRYYMYHKRISTAIVFMLLFTVIELICASIAWRSFGKNLWGKIHEALHEPVEDEGSSQ